MPDYESALETIWRDLRQHLEWADGFLLVLLYTRHPTPARELLRRAESLLQTRGLEPLLLRPRDTAQAHAIVQTVIAARPEPGGERPAIWLDLWDRSSDAEWQAQRYEILARLNERRFLLEQKVGRPLVLILPEDDRARMHILAPDLWTVRAYSVGLPVPVAEESRFESSHERASAAIDNTPAPIETEWLRLLAAVPEAERAARLDPRDGIAASRAALERGALVEAAAHAKVALAITRARQVITPDDSSCIRELSSALNAVGNAWHAAGNLEAARSAYLESLALRRQLRETLGDTPQALRDLLVSLGKVGGVSRDLGALDAARVAYEESLNLSWLLRATLGDTPQVLRDLLVSFDKVGGVSRDLGDLDAAQAAYEESLALCRQLRQTLGDTPQTLRDLSVSLSSIGHVSRSLGDLEAARVAYGESLDILQRLLAELGSTPQALRDLSVLLYSVGQVSRDLGDQVAACTAWEESLTLSRQLRVALGDTPLVLEDLARGLAQQGYLQRDLVAPAAARAAFQEGAELAARLVALQPNHPGYRKLQAQLQAEQDKLPP